MLICFFLLFLLDLLDELQEHVESIDMANGKAILVFLLFIPLLLAQFLNIGHLLLCRSSFYWRLGSSSRVS